MAHHNTVFAQLLKLVPRHEFESLAKAHHSGRQLRRTNRWSQFVMLVMGQLSGRRSLRDIESNARAQERRWYHLGAKPIARSSLARLNAKQPASLFEHLFGRLYQRCASRAPGHGFRFKNKLFSLDASLIDLSLKIFPWAHYAKGKGAMKLHLSLDHDGMIPNFAVLSEARCYETRLAHCFHYPAGSIVVFDRGYSDYSWHKQLNDQGIFFVTRQRGNARYEVVERRKLGRGTGLKCDQVIRLTGKKSDCEALPLLRRVRYRDPESGKVYVFVTNNFHLAATTIAEIYRQRWQIELFFKWIKQNLQIKAFLGTSINAVMTQIWIALCVYLLLAYLKFSARLAWSLQQMTRLLQLNLFQTRPLIPLLRGDPEPPDDPLSYGQIPLV